MNPVYAAMPTTVFEEMSGLARRLGAINLGQGFPEGDEPAPLIEAAARALREGSNQYPPSAGLPVLREAVATFYARTQGLDLSADEVLVTSGATEALAAALLAVVSPGDEVIVFEPMYDAYRPLIERAGGVAVAVALAPPDWALPVAAVRAAVGPRTRALVLNNPVNPVAKVFGKAELSDLAALCVAHDLVAICDEVWEQVLFDGAVHVPLISLSGMAGRTIKIGSAGKIFGLTGWKVGFVVAAPGLLKPVANAHQFLTFTTPPNLQAAVAEGLALPAAFFAGELARLAAQRARLHDALGAAGFVLLPGAGTYFTVCDAAASGIAGSDVAIARAMVAEARVASIPLAPFYMTAAQPGLVRFCFAKPLAVLDEAVDRLARWRDGLARGADGSAAAALG